tara:strand:- start:429 stop:797 length:369 start_codon:yes stop_codon:yes gene_type:complete
MTTKSVNAYKTISEVAKILDLKSKNNGKLQTHTIRFWEKEFKQIRPKILRGNRRYYDKENIEILLKIKFLLKQQGMTIKGAKKILNKDDTFELDELLNKSIKTNNLVNKLKKISNLLKDLKK